MQAKILSRESPHITKVSAVDNAGNPLAVIEGNLDSRFERGTIEYHSGSPETRPRFITRVNRFRFSAESEEEYTVCHPDRLIELLCGVLGEHDASGPQRVYESMVYRFLDEAPRVYSKSQVAEAIRIMRDAGDSKLSAVDSEGMGREISRHYKSRQMDGPPPYDSEQVARDLADNLGPIAYSE
jgi:hypothetical protein